MAEEIKQEFSITLTEKIVMVVLIGYVIALIWLVGSSHWLGIW
jgi:hypothetical protein